MERTDETGGQVGVRFGSHLVAFSVGYVVFSSASVPGVVMEEFDVGFTAVGLLMSAALTSFVAVQLIGGRLVDDRPTPPCCSASSSSTRASPFPST